MIGGPHGDSGVTGRKIIVDTYGGMGRHGGGAFSGKDPTKVDRSAAYMARYVAKNIVASRLAERCEIQLAYAIGVSEPVSVHVDTQGTGTLPDSLIAELVRKHFRLNPSGIIKHLDLRRPIYRKTASGGHFGRSEPEFTWEKTDKAHVLREAANAIDSPPSTDRLSSQSVSCPVVSPSSVKPATWSCSRHRRQAMTRTTGDSPTTDHRTMSATWEALLARARAAFTARFGGEPAVMGWAPGRVELLGNHTDYNGGLVMAAAIDRSRSVVGRRADGREATVRLGQLRPGRRLLARCDRAHRGRDLDPVCPRRLLGA